LLNSDIFVFIVARLSVNTTEVLNDLERTTVKKTLITILLLICAAAGNTALADTQVFARVKADRVNLRAKSDLQSETVGQLSAGTMLKVKTIEGEWLQIVPPEETDFWIHKDFIENDVVLVNKLNARSGAGINYNVVGTFAKGEKIVRRGSFGEWVKVAPSADASLWVNSNVVELVYPTINIPLPVAVPKTQAPLMAIEEGEISDRAVASLAEDTVDDDQNTYSTGRAPAADASAPPADLNLIPLAGQGKVVKREGELKRAPMLLFKSPATHRLIKREGNKLMTTAYVRGNTKQLDSLLNQHIAVQGREYWVENVKAPVVVIEAIERRNY